MRISKQEIGMSKLDVIRFCSRNIWSLWWRKILEDNIDLDIFESQSRQKFDSLVWKLIKRFHNDFKPLPGYKIIINPYHCNVLHPIENLKCWSY